VTNLKFAMFGAGFWARFQLAGWKELQRARCVAICDPTVGKAEALAREFGVPAAYSDPQELLLREKLNFVDIVTDVGSHSTLVHLAASRKLPVICQKPMAPSLEVAAEMVGACLDAGVPLFVNENWRWQTPIRQVKSVLDSHAIGTPFRARIDMISGFPVFRNQPLLGELEQFILADLGSHLLDVARFLFGEANCLYCQTQHLHPHIKGEDVATVAMRMGGKATVLVEMAYAENPLEHECFPQTLMFIEGDKGSVELCADYWIRVTTSEGTHSKRYPPPRYAWVDSGYEVVQSSIVPCQASLLRALWGEGEPETTGQDNLRTVRLVFASYDSARHNKVIEFR
jgi:predicted dehydrogenase